MTKHQTGLAVRYGKKAKRFIALAFFLCAAIAPSLATTNSASGTTYQTNLAKKESIRSIESGTGSLIIGYEDTCELTLSHQIQGSISIDNSFDELNIYATNSSLAGTKETALTVQAGKALNIFGGNFSVTNISSSGGNGPIMPPGFANNIAIEISDTDHTTLTGTTISGGTESGIGGTALRIEAGALTIAGDSVLTGGQGAEAIFASHADLLISNGTFNAGAGGITLALSDESSAIINDGSFSSETNKTTFLLLDSDLQMTGGSVSNASLLSLVSAGETSTAVLHSGTFNWLQFNMNTNGSHILSTGTNFIGNTELFHVGGNMVVTNATAETFSSVYLSGDASIEFLNAFTITSNETFKLDSNADQATFSALNIESNATLSVGEGFVSVDTFTAEAFSTNRLSITSSTNGWIDAHTATFRTNAVLVINTENIGTSSIETNEFTLISAGTNQLIAGSGVADTASFTNTVTVIHETGAGRMESAGVAVVNDSVMIGYTAQALGEYWNLTNGTSAYITEAFAAVIDQPTNTAMLAGIDSFNSAAASLAAVEQTYFAGMNTFQTSLIGLQSAMGMAPARGAEFREELKLIPLGAKEPQINNDIRGWGKYYGSFLSHEADGLNAGYDTTLHGGVFGVDKSFGNLLIGLSGGAGAYRTTTDNDAEENVTAVHGALYGTYGGEKLWFDAAVALGFNQVETTTAEPFVLEGEFDAQLASAYIGGGYDMASESTVFTPEVSLEYTAYEQDAYTETGTAAVPRIIDAAEAHSLRSSIGVDITMLNTIAFENVSFKVDGRGHWLHEFNPDLDAITFQLEGGTRSYQLTPPSLDEDLVRAGFGISFFNAQKHKPQNVMLRIDFDELFGQHLNAHNLSAKVVWAF